METIWSSLFWFFLAILFACLEIEAEGKYGWAEKMPTWYRTKGWMAKFYGACMEGKPLTGYHFFMFPMPLLIFHSQFIGTGGSAAPWSLEAEIMCLAVFFAWFPIWDYLWFVLNPHYGVKHFKKENVWWHSGIWIPGIMPLGHIIGWGISIGLAVFAENYFQSGKELFKSHLHLMGIFLLLTVNTILLSPFYHRWYKNMRQQDDRDSAGIKHELPESLT